MTGPPPTEPAPQAVQVVGLLQKLANGSGNPTLPAIDIEPERVRVLIADRDGLARRLLCDAVRDTPGMSVVACIADAREALELTRHYQPHVLLVDTRLVSETSSGFVQGVRKVSPETRILTISAEVNDPAAIAAIRSGAHGHLSKNLPPDRLARLMARAAAGEAIVPRGVVRGLLDLLHRTPQTGWRPLHSRLTTREWEIVELLADGASTEQIADTLVLSVETVYSHVKSLLRKLGVSCREEAVLAAQQLRHEEVSGRKAPDAAV